MNCVLLEMSVLPLGGQVAVQDVGTTDLPQWGTGEERAVATSRAILVATRPDIDGDVTIRIVRGLAVERGDPVFDGELTLTGTTLEVGNAVAGSLRSADVGRSGPIRVRIFAEPAELPADITVVVDP